MIRHIVFFKMKHEALENEGVENANLLGKKIQTISQKILGVIDCEIGFNYNKEKDFYELCLNQKFESAQALEDYLVNPLHLEVREFVFKVIEHRMVVDYQL